MELTAKQEEQKISNKEIYSNLYHTGGIYGYMYGQRSKFHSLEKDIIFIKSKNLKVSKQADCFIYVWGWPGPDVNFYQFKDYGKTWSFNKEDLIGEEEVDLETNS